MIEVPRRIGLKQEMLLLAPYFLTFLLVVFIVAFLQKDFGQVALLGGILFILLIFANRSYKVFVSLGIIGIVGFIGLIVAAPIGYKESILGGQWYKIKFFLSCQIGQIII